MTSETSGRGKSAEDRIEELKEKLANYEDSLGFKVRTENDEASKLLRISQEELRKMSSDECGEAAYSLTQYLIYLQKMINKESATLNWCESAIDFAVVKTLNNYKAYSYQERKLLAINDNEFAKSAMKIKVIAQSRIDGMAFITNKIQDLVKILMNMQQNKRVNRYGNAT